MVDTVSFVVSAFGYLAYAFGLRGGGAGFIWPSSEFGFFF